MGKNKIKKNKNIRHLKFNKKQRTKIKLKKIRYKNKFLQRSLIKDFPELNEYPFKLFGIFFHANHAHECFRRGHFLYYLTLEFDYALNRFTN